MSSVNASQERLSAGELPKGFHWLDVLDVRTETRDACSVQLAVPPALQEQFRFSAGQYITVMKEIDGEQLRRPYSLCMAPQENEWRFCCKRIPDGRMSGYLNTSLKQGDQLAVMLPGGRFAKGLAAGPYHYVGIAGGSGITPVISLVKTLLTTEPSSSFTLFYGNRTTPDIIFRELLLDLKNRYLGRLQIFNILSEEQTDVDLFHGLLDSDKVETLVSSLTKPQLVERFFICGPGPMMDGAEQALNRLGIDADRILKESFGKIAPHAGVTAKPQVAASSVTATIRTGGSTQGVEVADGQSVLDAALAAGLDLPYACKGGVCCTCKARLTQGTVHMAVNYGLEADEIERGYILTCQAIPTSGQLTVDYDG